MSLATREVRNPVPRTRAEKVLSALEAGGALNEYIAAGAISPSDGVALLRPKAAAVAMTLADGTVPGETMRVEMADQSDPTYTAVLTPATFADGATMTFDAKGQFEILIWVDTTGWTVRPGGTSTIA